MRVHVLHHAACFDGAASCAVFGAFYRSRIDPSAELSFLPKQHRPGDPFDASDFAADEVAVLDFRYTTADALVWYFDHHQSAFQLAGERDHFTRDDSGRKFHDARAKSCAGLIGRVAARQFGFDPTPLRELLEWAEIIDSAAFPDPETPVSLQAPALRLMMFAEQALEPELIPQFVEDLGRVPLARLAAASYITAGLEPTIDRHRADIELLRSRLSVHGGVMEYELLDQPPRAYNKFIPYFHHPRARYLVGLSVGPDGRLKLCAGYNPWLPAREREHDIAALCERFGGGGHPFVGGVSFAADAEETARQTHRWMAAILRGELAP